MAVEIRILVDNTASQSGLLCEHGMSALVRGPDRDLIFDTGASPGPLVHNAERLGVDLAAGDGVVISHGHYGHTGGLGALLDIRPDLTIYVHPAAFSRRWAEAPGQPLQDVSCPHSVAALSKAGARLHFVKAAEKVAEWLVLSGPIGGPPASREGFIVRRSDQMVADGFADEMFMLARGKDGWVVLSGCCHRGLPNTLRAAKFLAHDEPITAVAGGLHLETADESQMERIVEALRHYGSPELYPCHCTGEAATIYLQDNLPGKVHPLSAGDSVEF